MRYRDPRQADEPAASALSSERVQMTSGQSTSRAPRPRNRLRSVRLQISFLADSALMMISANSLVSFVTSRGENVSVVPDQIT